jgi:ABC-type phosphate/phosphonate transport system permease subunit
VRRRQACRRRSQVLEKAWEQLSNPFYDAGPNDKGIGIQIGYSIYRVLSGYFLAALVAIPLGFLIGMSPVAYKALNPFIQVLRPISPLAWMPLALFIIQDSETSAIFVIFICSIWPMLINTAFGVAGVRKDWVNVARTHELGSLRTAFMVILPAAAPTIRHRHAHLHRHCLAGDRRRRDAGGRHRHWLLRLERVEQPRPDLGDLLHPDDRCRRHGARRHVRLCCSASSSYSE